MNQFVRLAGFGLLALGLVPVARASVILGFTDNDATPTSATVARGGTFPVSVKVTSSSSAAADQFTGLDYFLQASTAGIFTIVSRNTQTSGSSFPNPYVTDATVAGQALSPKSANNLGGSISNVNAPVSNGTFEQADYIISVASGATPGASYTLSFAASPTYVGPGVLPGPTFTDFPFSSVNTFTVTIPTPEPTMLSFLGLGSVAVLARRRRVVEKARTCPAE